MVGKFLFCSVVFFKFYTHKLQLFLLCVTDTNENKTYNHDAIKYKLSSIMIHVYTHVR